MKDLSASDVMNIANLAMLEVSESEVESLRHDLNGILHAFEALDRIVMDNDVAYDQRSGMLLSEVSSQGEDFSRMRTDSVGQRTFDSAVLSANFPEREGNLMVVPQVVDRDE